MTVVEIFKTNVQGEATAKEVVNHILSMFPMLRINFDLQDCDKILRVEGAQIEESKIVNLVQSQGYLCVHIDG